MTLTGERGGKGEKGGAGRRERGVGGKGEATTHSFLKKRFQIIIVRKVVSKAD